MPVVLERRSTRNPLINLPKHGLDYFGWVSPPAPTPPTQKKGGGCKAQIPDESHVFGPSELAAGRCRRRSGTPESLSGATPGRREAADRAEPKKGGNEGKQLPEASRQAGSQTNNQASKQASKQTKQTSKQNKQTKQANEQAIAKANPSQCNRSPGRRGRSIES